PHQFAREATRRASPASFQHGQVCLSDTQASCRFLLIPTTLLSSSFQLFHGIVYNKHCYICQEPQLQEFLIGYASRLWQRQACRRVDGTGDGGMGGWASRNAAGTVSAR